MSNIVRSLVFAAIMLAVAFGHRAGMVSDDFSKTMIIVLPLLLVLTLSKDEKACCWLRREEA